MAKTLLYDLTGKEAVVKYKFISEIHKNIWKGKELISKHINNKELCYKTDVNHINIFINLVEGLCQKDNF
jgi:hypothetical protein